MSEQLKALGLQQGIGAVDTVTSLEQAAHVLSESRCSPGYIFGYIAPWANTDGRVESSVKVVCFFRLDEVADNGQSGMPMLLEARP